jgi:hypothetical protein
MEHLMLYFLVVPLFILWLLLAGAMLAASRFVPQLRLLYPWVVRICLWSTLGVIVANGAMVWLLTMLDHAGQPFLPGSFADELFRLAVGLAVVAGPLLASACGSSAGALLGAVLAFLKTGRAATSQALPARAVPPA